MGIIGEKSEEVVSRKDYLRNKKKAKYKKFKIVPTLITLFIIVLSIYVYKQLQLYNSVTKIANDVIEENALITTQKIYYVGISYTKEDDTNIIEYGVQDKSRTTIEGSGNMKSIQVDNKYIYGILKNELYKIDREAKIKTKVTKNNVAGYLITEKYLYYYVASGDLKGLYLKNKDDGKEIKITTDTVFQMAADDKNIYLISSGTTAKSIVRYTLAGKNKKILSGKQIASNLIVGNKNIYYANRSDNGKIYYIEKASGKSGKLIDKEVVSYSGSEISFITNNTMIELNNKLYFIEKATNKLFELDLKTMKEKKIEEENVKSVNMYSDKQICYTKTKYIGIYGYDISFATSEKITSARMTEFICVNK